MTYVMEARARLGALALTMGCAFVLAGCGAHDGQPREGGAGPPEGAAGVPDTGNHAGGGSGGIDSGTDASSGGTSGEPDASISPDGGAGARDGGEDAGSSTPDAGEPEPDGGKSAAPCSLSQPSLRLALPNRMDALVDERRCRVYVSTRIGTIVSYDLQTGEQRTLVALGGTLLGIDLSPDGNTLLVADANTSPSASKVHVVDLRTNAPRTIQFPLESLQAGTVMPLFLDDTTFLLTSSFAGSGGRPPLWRVRLRDGAFETLAWVTQSTMLALSADRATVAYAEANISSGEFGLYRPSDGTFVEAESNSFNYEIGVNRNGTQFAIPSYQGLLVYRYGSVFGTPVYLGLEASLSAVGAVFSPDSDVLYVAWVGGPAGSSIEAFDSNRLAPLKTLDSAPGLTWVGNVSFDTGRLRISAGGNVLVATVNGGVKLYATR